PSQYVFSNLEEPARDICDAKVLQLEGCLEEYLQETLLSFGENAEEVIKSQMDFLLSCVKLIALRAEYMRVAIGAESIKSDEVLRNFYQLYKKRIIVPAIRLYYKLGAKGGASTGYLISDQSVMSTVDFDFNRIAQAAFEKCQTTILQDELLREYTRHLFRLARTYFDRLTDERTGRLYKIYESIEVPSPLDNHGAAYRLAEEDCDGKANIIAGFIAELYRFRTHFIKEQRDTKLRGSKALSSSTKREIHEHIINMFEEQRMFCCSKDQLSDAVIKLAVQLAKWQEKRHMEQEQFGSALLVRVSEMLRNSERLVRSLLQEKEQHIETYRRDVRLSAAILTWDLSSNLSSISVELNELRKVRRVDERKIRTRIISEYEDLVRELVMEVNMLRNRFSEYRMNTVHEVMNIMSETKREELGILVENREIPAGLKASALEMIKNDEAISSLRAENHELNMTLLKVRSMFFMKEQALRSMYEKKTQTLMTDSKRAEEKLWDSYRDAEARERALRRELSRVQKALATIEVSNDILQRQVKEEVNKDRATSAARRSAPAGSFGPIAPGASGDPDVDAAKMNELLQERLRRYEGINIDQLLHELTEKTLAIEKLIEDKRSGE
ncbi:hypothetical protein BDK51DRAFT_14745, partial [Blyttiomyces helicus]